MEEERLYVVAYDISDRRRWRRVFKLLHGYGDWLQLSVFQCRLTRRRRAELETQLRQIVKQIDDHVLLIDVGLATKTHLAVQSIGKNYESVERKAVVI